MIGGIDQPGQMREHRDDDLERSVAPGDPMGNDPVQGGSMSISPEELDDLIAVAKAYGWRAAARQHAKDAKHGLEREKANARAFGLTGGEVGEFHDARVAEARGVFNAAVANEVASEKTFKKARLSALERHPRLDALIDRFIHGQAASASNDGPSPLR